MTAKKRILSIAGFASLLLVAIAGIFYWITTQRYLETTDNAYIKADSIVISPKINGYVANVLVRDNQQVEAGQPLIRVERTDYEVKVEQQQAALRSNEAALV